MDQHQGGGDALPILVVITSLVLARTRSSAGQCAQEPAADHSRDQAKRHGDQRGAAALQLTLDQPLI